MDKGEVLWVMAEEIPMASQILLKDGEKNGRFI